MRSRWDRDAAVERVSALTRAAVAGSIALSVAFTALVAWAHPGRAKSRTGASGTATAPVSPSSPTSTSNRSEDAPVALPTSTAAPNVGAPETVPPSTYTPQPYVGGGGGAIVSGQT
jgi:hypothetical protein